MTLRSKPRTLTKLADFLSFPIICVTKPVSREEIVDQLVELQLGRCYKRHSTRLPSLGICYSVLYHFSQKWKKATVIVIPEQRKD